MESIKFSLRALKQSPPIQAIHKLKLEYMQKRKKRMLDETISPLRNRKENNSELLFGVLFCCGKFHCYPSIHSFRRNETETLSLFAKTCVSVCNQAKTRSNFLKVEWTDLRTHVESSRRREKKEPKKEFHSHKKQQQQKKTFHLLLTYNHFRRFI